MEHDEDQADQQVEEVDGDTNVGAMGQVLGDLHLEDIDSGSDRESEPSAVAVAASAIPIQANIAEQESGKETERLPSSTKPRSSVAWEIDKDDFKAPRSAKSQRLGLRVGGFMKNMTPLEAKARSEFGKVVLGKTEGSVGTAAGEESSANESCLQNSVAAATEISLRKVLNQQRWICLSRPQYPRSCGISSLVSCWNYLFSNLGSGSLPAITQEEALTVLGFRRPFQDIAFGPFTGNATLMRWFHDLNDHYGVSGQASYFYKTVGKIRSSDTQSDRILPKLKEGLRNDRIAYIYHCENHYCCPIGYEDVPRKAEQAYSGVLEDNKVDTWILIGDPSRTSPGILCAKWANIVTDLTRRSPAFFNIRKPWLGVQKRTSRRPGRNNHCLLEFRRVSLSRGQITKVAIAGLGQVESEDESMSGSEDEATQES